MSNATANHRIGGQINADPGFIVARVNEWSLPQRTAMGMMTTKSFSVNVAMIEYGRQFGIFRVVVVEFIMVKASFAVMTLLAEIPP